MKNKDGNGVFAKNNEMDGYGQQMTVYELCKGGSCCPVLVVRDDGVISLKEGNVEIFLERDILEHLRDVINSLLDSK